MISEKIGNKSLTQSNASPLKIIVVSAVGLRQGGTLTILQECLNFLSSLTKERNLRIIAIVHNRKLVDFEGIEYIEYPNVIKSWWYRLWCEYVTMHKISRRLPEIDLWFSLHDTTPNVYAKRQAVYCQTSFPFYRCSWRDFVFNYKIALFSLFTRYAYRINVHRNRYLVVQQQWLRDGLSKMLGVDRKKFVVAPPQLRDVVIKAGHTENGCFTFLYAAAPDCHKNFEVICRAAALLEKEVGKDCFKVALTLSGTENRYAHWLYKKWRAVYSIDFVGYMNKERLYGFYSVANCLIHASKIETWGLPISEFGNTGKPMIVPDLPYAHSTAAGFPYVAFFNPRNALELKDLMRDLLCGDYGHFLPQPYQELQKPYAHSWRELFDLLLQDSK